MLLVLLSVVAGCAGPHATPGGAVGPVWCADRASVVVLGDAHGTGFGLPGYDGEGSYAATTAGWVSTLARRASAEWGTVTTVLAHTGAAAADFRPGGRWEDTAAAAETVHDLRPALALVVLGATEYALDVPPARFDADYRAVVDGLREASPRTAVLLVLGPEPGARLVADPAHDWDDYRAVIETVAADEGAPLLDLGEYLPPGGTPDAEGLYLPDGVHLTAAGHRIVHAAVWTLLTASCGP
ncbi:SGNH/GDSL hydrolase family protein [Saccharomonospora piscinae]|uniref:SGNH/GDSL hydrolase family protein n=1 Tax=Saccharomonospora piscinae TaxID=687388 RepID=UPI0011073911|nr:SGNH/GDSL hydrolase family protein [Saccharomonospora piscinae]TLW89702.1 SGNH/GDSL hydrolase family protein [Saccharomonospora piscinae]